MRPAWLKLWVCLGLLTGVSPVSALDPARSIYQYNCRSWARQNGLPASCVSAITQTSDGYLWLGTPRGLVRFDGNDFKLLDVAGLPEARSAIVTSLSRSRRGGLWFGLERGGFGFSDGRALSLLGREEWGGRGLYVNSLLEGRDGHLWIASERLAARLTPDDQFEPILTQASGTARYDAMSVFEDSRGRIWLGTAQQGLFYWQNGTLTKFPDPVFNDLTIHAIVEDKRGQIWVGTQNGLLAYDSDFKRQRLPFPWYETRALLADREGVVWAGTSGGGLVRFLGANSTSLRAADGLADDYVRAIAEDDEGSLWVGTRNGLSQLSQVKIPTLGRAEGFTADFNVGICPSRRGGFWVGTGSGFMHFDGARVRPYGTNVGLSDGFIKQMLESRSGDLYLVNGKRDIEIFSGDRIVARYANKSWPSAMTEDEQGVVVAINGSLFRVGTNRFEAYEFAGEKPPLRWIFCMITARDGAIWLAGHSRDIGIGRIKDGQFSSWAQPQGLPDTKVLWLCEDDEGIVWAGLERGMARVKGDKAQVISQEHGLFDNIISSIVADDQGSLWVDSSRGFFRVSRKSLNDFAEGRANRVQCTAYDGVDVIKSSEKYLQEPSGCKTPDGRVWFPTAQGIVMIDPTNLTANPVPPKVHLQMVRANGQDVDRNQTRVRPGKGDLEFHYAGLSFIAPVKIQYRYRLEGYDKEWVKAGTRREAFYTNLRPGKYRFHVQACNADGVWNEAGAAFDLELQPHFYQTGWFLTAVALLMAFGLFAIYAWRVDHLRRRQKQLQEAHDLLETKVKERTAELAQSNRSLKNEIEERKRMEQEVERIHRELVDASRKAGQADVASSVLHNVGNVLNSVNVSSNLVTDRVRNMHVSKVTQSAKLILDHTADIGAFLTRDDRGAKLPAYLQKLGEHLEKEQQSIVAELRQLIENVQHINEIVAMQQNHATSSGVVERVSLSEVAESALKMHAAAFRRHVVEVAREYEELPPMLVDRHKVLQILINILHNAKYACDQNNRPDKRVSLKIRKHGEDQVAIEIADNGIGIAPENLTRIFAHGFTTRKNGHGFGLHSAALAAKEMGGALVASSEGVGKGATFTLSLPLASAEALPGVPNGARFESTSPAAPDTSQVRG